MEEIAKKKAKKGPVTFSESDSIVEFDNKNTVFYLRKEVDDAQKEANEQTPELQKLLAFWDLPLKVQLSLVKKLDARSMTRFRRTSKKLNAFLEEQTDIRSRSSHSLILRISRPFSRATTQFLIWTTNRRLIDEYGVLNMDLGNEAQLEINKPAQQLANVFFECIVVDLKFGRSMSAKPLWEHFVKRVMSTVKKLHLECNTLAFNNIGDSDVSVVLPHFKYSSFTIVQKNATDESTESVEL